MIVLNFSHSLTDKQCCQIEKSTGEKIFHIRDIPIFFDKDQPFTEQTCTIIDSIGLTTEEWQSLPILINPPAHSLITAIILAELHGRMGYFPTVTRLKPVAENAKVRYGLAEIINLQAVRNNARSRR